MHDDSAPGQKARKVTRYVEQKQINILEWPGNSPDLNLIENCWHKIKKLCLKKINKPWSIKRRAEKKCGARR